MSKKLCEIVVHQAISHLHAFQKHSHCLVLEEISLDKLMFQLCQTPHYLVMNYFSNQMSIHSLLEISWDTQSSSIECVKILYIPLKTGCKEYVEQVRRHGLGIEEGGQNSKERPKGIHLNLRVSCLYPHDTSIHNHLRLKPFISNKDVSKFLGCTCKKLL